MQNVTVFMATATKKHTHYAVTQFLQKLHSHGDIQSEIVNLNDYHLEFCRGCKVCFEKGEDKCPLQDDRDILIEKIKQADAVVFACPNYSFQVPAVLKAFLDRMGFIFHRPQFFGKTFTSIVAQGIFGGNRIVSYLDFVGNGLGFNTVKGSCVTALAPMTAKEKLKIDKVLTQQSLRFYQRMQKNPFPKPGLFKLMGFRMARTSMQIELDDRNYDYRYFSDKGWFNADYFYPTQLGIIKKMLGKLFDRLQTRLTTKRLA